MSPAAIGETSPAVTAVIASSSSATPSPTLSSRINARPQPCRAIAIRSTSRNTASDVGGLAKQGVRPVGIAFHDTVRRPA